MADTFTVERARTLEAPVDRVYLLVESFHQWLRWSPWEGLDPDMKRAFGGPEGGEGATYAWAGNRKAGAGRMEITHAEENRLLEIDLEFDKPYKSKNSLSFAFTPIDDHRTEVTWSMTGPRPLLLRLVSPVYSLEKAIGKDFERGLGQLEDAARPTPAG